MPQVQESEFEHSLREASNPDILDHAHRILHVEQVLDLDGYSFLEIADTSTVVRAVLQCVFEDEGILSRFEKDSIRHVTMCGLVACQILTQLDLDTDGIHLMTIGDISLPQRFQELKDRIRQRASDYYNSLPNRGYDLAAKGEYGARSELMSYVNDYYGFSDAGYDLDLMIQNSALVAGGMVGLDKFVTAFVHDELEKGSAGIQFLSPDNSFGTWKNLVDAVRLGREGFVDSIVLPTLQKHGLHLSSDAVLAYYEQNVDRNRKQVWYITPVGNPSGTTIDANQLLAVCSQIVDCSPDAVIVIDAVYVRLLGSEDRSRELLKPLLSHLNIVDRIIFLESASKTHAIPNERLGFYWTTNPDIYNPIQKKTTTGTAGSPAFLNAMAHVVATLPPDEKVQYAELHQFWADERQGLYEYLIGSGRFSHLFHADQSHIDVDALQHPQGLYIFLRLADGVDATQVLLDTHCLGVPTKMGPNGAHNYLRFSVGTLQKMTFSKE